MTPNPENVDSPRTLVGEKRFAYDVNTRERIYANEARAETPYRVREGYCHRVWWESTATFAFYSDDWHVRHGFRERPGSGAVEGLAHEAAVQWVYDEKRLSAATPAGPLMLRFTSVTMEFWTGARRPDLRCVVADCWPRGLLRAGDVLYVEICSTCPVDDARRADLLLEGVPTLEITLDADLAGFDIADGVSRSLDESIRHEMSRCPPATWVVPPT